MKRKVIFATSNEGKMKEVRSILEGLDVEVLSMKEAGILVEVVEDGTTFEENAAIKATAIQKECGEIVLADDSGLEVDYLNKEPGIYSARYMAEEGDRQLSIPGVLEGTVKPDYNRCVEMAAKNALKKMLLPSMLALLIPIVGGFFFGVEFVGGILVGATICAIPRALFMGNSGGAFDNAKKYIESGSLEGHGKGSAAHKAAVTGDTIGDTRKDVVGVALDIFIKMMSTVANTLVGVIQRITLFR